MLSRRDALIAAATLAAAPLRAETPNGNRSFTILHTNDFHGRHSAFEVAPGDATAQTGDYGRAHVEFDREGRIGGFPALAAVVRERRSALGSANVLLVDGGDTFSDDLLGNLTKGEAMIRLMNAVGYQFMALGNHDFDYGFERTRELAKIAHFPLRGANITERRTGKPVFGDPTLITTLGGVSVGLIALGYHNTELTGDRRNVRDLGFANGIETARQIIPNLRRQVEAVVVVSHQGSKVDRLLLQQVEGIDLVIGAHSHDLITPPERVGGGWLAQAMSDGAMLGEVTVSVRDGKVADVTGRVHALWADRVGTDPEISTLLARLREPHLKALETVIAQATDRIGRQYKSESPFDKLVGRILRQEKRTEIALLPGVGYGVSLTKGPITREALSTLLPHPSKVSTLTLTGAQIREILEQSATNQEPGDVLKAVGGLIQTDGLRWSADLRREPGQRVGEVMVGDGRLDPSRRYSVVTNSGMLGGLHRYDVLTRAENIRREDRSVTDVVEATFRQIGAVSPPQLGDLKISKSSG